MKRVIVLRPEPGASATVERARQRGLDAVAIPLFNIERVPWKLPDVSGFDGLLLTSANAVREAGEKLSELTSLPLFAVGSATAEAARGAGFDIAGAGNGGVDELLASIAPEQRLLHLCGEDRRQSGGSPRITPVVVYRSVEQVAPDLGPARGAVALIHSPRAGRRFAELVGDRGSIAIAAISAAAADSVGSGWEGVEPAESPSDDALLALAERLCNKPPQI
jgi:uroporphyrinogen-III synthase